MTYSMNIIKLFCFVILASLLITGCSKDDNPTGPEVPTPPSFAISSHNVQMGGVDYIQFYARPNMNISLIRVDITNPLGNKQIFNVGGGVFLTEEVIHLQDPNWGYYRISGSWDFRFVGNHEPTKEGFDVTQTLNVSAKIMP